MANLADKSGDAYSNIVQGKGTGSLSFPMPATVPLDVESVVATIDNTLGAATTATLVVRDSSGEVIATKRMGETFPAGDTGTVTFSLRNTDSSRSVAAGIKYDTLNVGDWLSVTTTGAQSGTNAIEFVTQNGNDINLTADPAGDGFMTLDAGSLFLISEVNAIVLTSPSSGVIADVGNTGAAFEIDGRTDIRLYAGVALTVLDRTGTPIFRVNEDGSLQGKTGKALTFNL